MGGLILGDFNAPHSIKQSSPKRPILSSGDGELGGGGSNFGFKFNRPVKILNVVAVLINEAQLL